MDRRKCTVFSCSKSGAEGHRLYGLPKDIPTRDKWLQWISSVNRTAPVKKTIFVCSDHFKNEDKGSKKLLGKAVPCIPQVADHSVSPNNSSLPQVIDHNLPENNLYSSASNPAIAPNNSSLQQVIDCNLPGSSSASNIATVNNSSSKQVVDYNVLGSNLFTSASNATIANLSSPPIEQVAGHGLANNFSLPQVADYKVPGKECVILSCTRIDQLPSGIDKYHLYGLPKDIPTRDKWLQWIASVNGTAPSKKTIFVCSDHFKNEDKGSKKLLGKAVPCIPQVADHSVSPNNSSLPKVIDHNLPENNLSSSASNPAISNISSPYLEQVDDQYSEYSTVIEINWAWMESQSESDCDILVCTDYENNENLSAPIHNPMCTLSANEILFDHNQNITSASATDNSIAGKRRKTPGCTKTCAAKDCDNLSERKFFTFPAVVKNGVVNEVNVDRCKVWIKNSGNSDLLDQSTSSLHGRYFLCSEHFADRQFYNKNRVTLLPTAVPSLFSCAPIPDDDMQKYPVWGYDDLMTDLNPNFDKLQINFEKIMNSFKWVTCQTCNETFYKRNTSTVKCLHGKVNCAAYSSENDMDPLSVPDELQGLSYVEEQLIAKVHPMISIFKLKGHHQYGYKGNIINFPQNVTSFAKLLPHNINDLKSTITIKTGNDVNPVDFHVRAGKIRSALLWLRDNNPYYHDIEISEENLNSLPQDGNVDHQIQITIEDESSNEDINIPDEDGPLIKETCVPMIGNPSTKEQAEVVLGWPEIGKDAVNEFKTPGYICMAFPTLFPYGKADLKHPREKKISPKKYFQHLMRYKDGRFAKHPRFRYFALNSIMRWSALSNGGIFVKKNSQFKDMKVEQLKEELQKNPSLIKKLMFYNSNLRGTRSYWYANGQELLAMIEQLGLPTLFFTLSAADLHWPDLFHFLAPDEDLNTMSDKRRRQLVQDNPAKVDAFFAERGKTFITEVLKKKFNVDDLWYRIEYQHRGSPHIHGVLWLKDAPKFIDLKHLTDDELIDIVKYFDQFISTTHPDINCPPADKHPCRVRLSEVVDVKKDLAELLNRVQRHTKCSEEYCLRKNKKKKGKPLECRFKFPVELREHSQIVISEDQDVQFLSARNDQFLNKYNQYIIQCWRANIDISPVLSKRALVNYLAKYITKSESQSTDMTEIMKELLNNTDSDKTAKSIIQRLYIQSCCERDFSAQETCHLIMGTPLHSSGGRSFVTINFKALDIDGWVNITDDESAPSKTFIEKYLERSENFESYSLWKMAKNFVLPSGKRHPKNLEAIVRVYPKISEKTKNDSDQYYRQQVLLHVPWRFEDQLLEQYETWEQAYLINEELIKSSQDIQCNLDEEQPDDPEYEDALLNERNITEQFMTLSAMGPSQNVTEVELGRREIDLNHDWHACLEKYEKYGGIPAIKSFIQDKKKSTITRCNDNPVMPEVQFTDEQQTVLDLLKLQIDSIKQINVQNTFALPQTVIVQGKAGTGKSMLIHAMKSMVHEVFGEDAIVLLGPTGVSALNINGSTINSKLYIQPKSKELLPLPPGALHEFRQKFEKIKFVVIDEYSMVGCNMLNKVQKRLQEALDHDDKEYGGVFLYFFGDINQLPPVGDSSAYKTNQVSPDYINGKMLFNNIDGSIVLSQVKRQSDEQFQRILSNVSTGTITKQDFNVLKKRFTTSVSPQERKSFDDAIHLYPKIKEVNAHNIKKLETLKDPIISQPVPIARVPAIHNTPIAAKDSANDAGGLSSVLYLAVGAKIMLRANLWTENGLVNGSIGRIVDILYDEDSRTPDDAPAAIVCHFDSYKGPYLCERDKTVVIEPITKQWKNKKGQDCTRIQFPLSLCWACSIHKSQGLTLEKAFINIGTLNEMAPGLTYTALSRVKSIAGLLLEPFGFKRLMSLNNKNYIKERQEWVELLSRKQISGTFL